MMENLQRAFLHHSRSWYAADMKLESGKIDEVRFGLYLRGDGTDGELAMVWYLQGYRAVPKLEAFDDSWRTLGSMPDLVLALAERDNQKMTAEAFCSLLLSLGFEDWTRTKPNS